MSPNEDDDEREIRAILGRPIANLKVPELAFLQGVGLRGPGRRLAEPVEREREGWRLVVHECVVTSQGTDLSYEVSGPGNTDLLQAMDVINFYVDNARIPAFATSAATHRVGQGVLRTAKLQPPLPEVQHQLQLEILGAQQWSVPLQLVPFERDRAIEWRAITARAQHAGVDIVVRGLAAGPEATGLDLEVTPALFKGKVVGIGGLHGRRARGSALTLKDQLDRTYPELGPRPHSHTPVTVRGEVILFEALRPDATRLELTVPYLYVEEVDAEVFCDLPLKAAVEAEFGQYHIRFLGSAPADAATAPPWAAHETEVALAVECDDWHGDRRLLFPAQAFVDGERAELRFTRGVDLIEPQPITQIIVSVRDRAQPHRLMLRGAVAQVRGPWRIAFDRT